MKTIILPADLSSDIDWKLQQKEAQKCCAPLLWEFDFGFSRRIDPAAFSSYILAIDHFCATLWKEFAHRSGGVVLYRGSLDIVKKIVAADDDVEAANWWGDFLHRLASFLPDEARPFCLFEGPCSFSTARAAQLMSKDRFYHLELSLEENTSPQGFLLPPDRLLTDSLLQKIDGLLRPAFRVIPEARLNEMWQGLDELIVLDEAVTPQGRRLLQGFMAAGGKVFGAEGFEPPTHCSQSSCASQTALCSEREES